MLKEASTVLSIRLTMLIKEVVSSGLPLAQPFLAFLVILLLPFVLIGSSKEKLDACEEEELGSDESIMLSEGILWAKTKGSR